MRAVLCILTVFCVIGLAVWAYRENYATQSALSETRALRAEIRAAHEHLAVLRAEWAFLNRPDRLRDLADMNFDRLGLLPLRPDQIGTATEVSFPPDPVIELDEDLDLAEMEDRP